MLRSYIAGVVKFCEKKGNAEKLTKWLGSYPTSQPEKNQFPDGPFWLPTFFHRGIWPHPRKDKYNRKLKKYYVDVEEEDEDQEAEEEREKEEHTMDVWV